MLQRILFTLNGALSPILGADPGVPAPPPQAQAPPAAAYDPILQPLNGYAAPPPATAAGGLDMWWIYAVYAAIIFGFYFFAIRPQRKRDKALKTMQAELRVGDNVLTTGGMYGRIADIGQDCFVVEFGTNRGVRIPVRKQDVLGKKAPQLTAPPTNVEE